MRRPVGVSEFVKSRGAVRLRVLLFCAAAMLTVRSARAQDGRALLLRSLQAYQNLHSYQGQANVDILFQDRYGSAIKHVASTTTMKYQKPNKLYLYFSTLVGSRSVYSDGIYLTIYDGLPKQYEIAPTGKTLGEIVVLLAKHVAIPVLDPLYFLSQSSLPDELTNLKFTGKSSLNGQQVNVITGMGRTSPDGGKTKVGRPTVWTWYTDSDSDMILRVEYRAENITESIIVPQKTGKPIVHPMVGTLIMRETISEVKPDAAISSDAFVFKRPPDAHERKATSALLKESN